MKPLLKMTPKFTFLLAIKSVFVIAVVLVANHTFGQVFGCRDPLATNYNPMATVNNGSCTYSTVTYTPPVKVNSISDTLVENSGLQWAGNSLWSFNDGGSVAALYRIDTATRNILQTVTLTGATNIDWEDITFDGTYFYIGDFGNNVNGARRNLKIYRFPLSAIPAYTSSRVVAIPDSLIGVINFTYSDQSQPPVSTAVNNTKFDCEAMIVDGGKIHLFTKNWIDNNSTHYVINGTVPGTYVATPVETLATGFLVTAADKVPGRGIIALLGYQNSGVGNHYIYLLTDYTTGKYFNGNKRRIDLPNASVMGQAEGITFRNGTYGYISNEKFTRTVLGITVTVNQRLRSFNIGNLVPQNFPDQGTTLSINFKALKAYQEKAGVQLEWETADENNVQHYQVEKSANGSVFTKAVDILVKANDNTTANYNWLDENATIGNNFYRVKAITKSGVINYSPVINIRIGYGGKPFAIYPNPVKDKTITLSINNQPKGNYLMEVFNNLGQQLFAKTIRHFGGSATQTIHINSLQGKGFYQLRVTNGETKIVRQLAFE